MDFSDTPKEAAFREEARAWLKSNVPTAQDLAGWPRVVSAQYWR